MKSILLFLTFPVLLVLTMGNGYAQNAEREMPDSTSKEVYLAQVNIDFGFGIDYGGLGCKLEIEPIKYLRVFACGGYYLRTIGWNAGLMFKILPRKRVCPNVLAMYGINGGFIGLDSYASQYNKISRGFTFGANVDFIIGKEKRYKILASLLVPVRSKEFMKVYNEALADPNLDMRQKLTPLLFSVGFGICL